ncbi:MAG: hypothetical protein IKF64_02285 [Eubacterium sp.]|nr:hypothetical protein [Eubacterium sp.]
MAEISARLCGISGEEQIVHDLLSFELDRDIDAPCDGLRITFLCAEAPFETDSITVFIDGEKVFFGYCDMQRVTAHKNGFEVFIYARSSASLLIDNEAKAITYNSPCVEMLYFNEAKRFGFKNELPNLYCNKEYAVSKGVSCYAAINSFLQTLASKRVYVNAENELYIPDGRGEIALDGEKIIRQSLCINRAKPIEKIDYKIDGDASYIRHYESEFARERKICRSRKVNIASIPPWQREYTLGKMMKSSFSDYCKAEITIEGIRSYKLYDSLKLRSFPFGSTDGFRLCKITLTQNENGAETALVFAKDFDLKEVTYVAE